MSYKTLLESLADENSKCAMAICMAPIESEREYLKNKIMRVKTENGWQRHEPKILIKFYCFLQNLGMALQKQYRNLMVKPLQL
jgi:hypothetical protein